MPGGAAPALALASGPLDPVQNGAAYSDSLAITGGTSPYSEVLVSGALPPGLTLDVVGSNLVIAGTAV